MNYESKLYTFDNIFSSGQMNTPAGEILQVSELSVATGSCIIEHTQWCDEITYFIQGSGSVVSGGVAQKISKGSIHYVKKGTKHAICADNGENLRFFCIGFLPNTKNDACGFFFDAVGDKTSFVSSDMGNIKHLSELLIREFYSYDDASFCSVSRYFEQLLIDSARSFKGYTGMVKGIYKGAGKNDVLYKALRFIDREYIGVTTVKEICEKLSYSEFYLSHLFREKMNMSIKEYLMKKKISHAEELLLTTELSIEDISDYFGFSSSHSFRRVFKQYTGKAPSSKRL